MAKKKSKKPKKQNAAKYENVLPQNIVPFGESVEEDKAIYISQSAYKEIHRFTKDKTSVESGGVLLGDVIEEFGKTNIVIHAFVEAKYSEGTPTTLKFTHKTWEYIHKETDKKYPKLKILGWIHTHPDFGIFLSDYDKFIQENFFSEENQIAYVVDPIRDIEGFYFWINGKIERCKGFFVFDKTGVKISVEPEPEEKAPVAPQSNSIAYKIIIGVLAIVVAGLLIFCLSLNSKISSTDKQLSELKNLVNQEYMEIESLRNQLGNIIEVYQQEKEDDSQQEQSDANASEYANPSETESEASTTVEDTATQGFIPDNVNAGN